MVPCFFDILPHILDFHGIYIFHIPVALKKFPADM